MKIEIKIELDKASQELIQATLNKVAENVVDFINLFERISVKTENAAPKTEDVEKESYPNSFVGKPKEAEAVQQRVKSASAKAQAKTSEIKELKSEKSIKADASNKHSASKGSTTVRKKKRTAFGIVFNTIKKSGGINVENLKKETGFSARKVADAVYRLKKTGKIEKTDGGLYIPIG